MRLSMVLLLAVVTLTACSESPTGRTRFALVPDPLMSDFGAQAFTAMKERQAVATDPAARALVQCISDEIVAAARRVYPGVDMPGNWQVVVFDNPSPNAFALPGGRIGVHTGLLRVAENPAQLAAVIGHEVAHVLADHGNERLTQELGISAVLFLVGLFSEGDLESAQLLRALGIGAELGIALPFSRAHESEADRMGLTLMAAAGFRPQASVGLWRNMASLGGDQPPEFLSTHPAHASRIEELEAHMADAAARYEQARPADCGR